MHRIDHVCIGARNLYEGAARLRDETGLDSYDGGWNPSSGIAQRIVPLGRHCYIEINSVIDHDTATRHFYGAWYEAVFADAVREDRFLGWVIAVDNMDELHAIADRIGEPIAAEGKWENGLELAWKRRLPDGRSHRNENVPDDRHHRWPLGLPMFMHWPDEANDHPDTIGDVGPVRHRVRPDGISWVEVGDEATT
ncbi:MAG TPA: VOC family protein, partial [Candidatus Limnocylindrales bacterium]|nr:VOC family protein [Candidatus Limnocylindrales bacterium]